jgi:hypothetical protein
MLTVGRSVGWSVDGGGGRQVKGAIKLYCRAGGCEREGAWVPDNGYYGVNGKRCGRKMSKRVNARCPRSWCGQREGQYIGSVVGDARRERTGAQGAKAARGGRPVTSSCLAGALWMNNGRAAAKKGGGCSGLVGCRGKVLAARVRE